MSRAKAHNVLEVEVVPATVAAMAMTFTITLIAVAPAGDRVTSKKICMNGKPVGVASKVSRGPVVEKEHDAKGYSEDAIDSDTAYLDDAEISMLRV